jgi:protocatechuate 3,4-dioxygenase beta subunit
MKHELEDHDLGLSHDLGTLVNRRLVLGLFAGVGVAALAGCGTAETPAAASSAAATGGSGATASTETDASCETIPEETGGPYPGDGSNGPNVLTESGIVRSDITKSFGSASGTAAGVPATVKLTIQDSAKGCAVMPDAAVYLWHCDREGRYSMYSEGVTDQNYLRGVQKADASGVVTFKTIFPAAYSGRWPHMHFEIYPSLSAATSAGTKLRTTQLALPKDACDAVYATTGYEQSVGNLAQTSLQSDMVFSDGYDLQVAAVTGNVTDGYTVTLTVAV